MLVPDVNLLIYAYNSGDPQHSAAKRWWEQALSGARPVGLAWLVVIAFIRITTKRSLIPKAASVGAAVATVRSWLALPHVEIIHPTERHAEILFALIEDLGTAGNLTSDAHLAALAIEYHATLATTDADFSRFRGLRAENPFSKRRT